MKSQQLRNEVNAVKCFYGKKQGANQPPVFFWNNLFEMVLPFSYFKIKGSRDLVFQNRKKFKTDFYKAIKLPTNLKVPGK